LPEAHVEAPTSGSVILAALLLKIGTYGFLRFVLTMMPVASNQLIPLILTLALVAIVFTSFTTSRQVDLKKILAYASIGHMNLLVVGLLSSNLTAIAGSILMHLSHGFVSAGLFIFVGQLVDRFYTRNIKYLRGLAGNLPIASTLFLLLTFANISVPGSFNFIAEILILMGAFTTNTWVASVAATAVLLGASYSL
jgi:NADH:ubiquinone oxidoreductase subunit 4 (subunit M)